MNDWSWRHGQYTSARAPVLRQRALFSDVEVHVQGVVFRSHRYVLAEASDFFFSLFTGDDSLLPPPAPVSTKVTVDDDNLGGRRFPESEEPPAAPTAVWEEYYDAYDDRYNYYNYYLQPPREGECLLRNHTDVNSVDRGNPRGNLYTLKSLKAISSSIGSIVSSESGKSDGAPTVNETYSESSQSSCGPYSAPFYNATQTQQLYQKPASSAVKESLITHQTSSSPTRVVLKLECVTAELFGVILDALYGGEDPATVDNVRGLYLAAHQLQISSLSQHCEQVIARLIHGKVLDPADVLLDPLMAENALVMETALDVLLTDFGEDGSKTAWFLSLSPQHLFSVLNDQRLNVRHEDQVYTALMNWYRHDPTSRHLHLRTALTQIRLANLSKRTLVDEVLMHPVCTTGKGNNSNRILSGCNDGLGSDGSDVRLLRLVQRALAYHVLPDRRHDETFPLAQFRPSQATERVLLALGDQSDKLYAFSFARKAWFRLAPPPQGLGLGVTACSHGDDLYVSGGDKAMAQVWRYRAKSNTWKRLADLNVGRRSHGSVSVGDAIYVLGGKDDKQSMIKDTLDSVEVLDLQDKGQGWSVMTSASLSVPVRSMAVAVVGEKIFILGGRTNGFQKTVDTIQCVDTVTRQSSVIGRLPSPSCLARPFVVNKVVHLLETSGDVLRFEPQNAKVWESTDRQKGNGDHTDGSATKGSNSQHSGSEDGCIPSVVSGSKRDGTKEGSLTLDEVLVSKVGGVQGLGWKWFGVARCHKGSLHVVAGELPPTACPDKLTFVTADCHDDSAQLTSVRFICPDKMALCYVSAHMCIPKTFLLEKLA